VSGASRLRWVVKYTSSGPSPTCDDRNIESPDEWGILKTTAIQRTGWHEDKHKTLPEEFWGAKNLEVRKGDVLITKAGPRQRVGVSAYVDKVQPRLIVSGKMIMLRVDESKIDPRYLNWQLSTPKPQAYLNACKSGMAEAQMNFANEDLLGMTISLPSLDEQRRIADFLDVETGRIDQLIAARRAQADCLGDLWDSRLAAAIGEQVKMYGWITLRRVVTSVEQGWSPQCDDINAEPDEWAVLKTSAVSSGEFEPLEHKRLPPAVEPNQRYRVLDGDILLTRGSGSPDHVGVAVQAKTGDRQMLLSDLLYRIRPGHGWSPEFVVLALHSQPVRGLMSLRFRGQSGQTIKLRAEDIRSIEIPAVPANFQTKVAAELSTERMAIRSASRSIETSLCLLGERRQALITAAVTGEIDVTTARGLVPAGGVVV
jgi:type I restriction enzyme S subunit